MLQQWMNWRSLLAIIAMAIVIATIFYSRLLAGKMAMEERHKVEVWAEAPAIYCQGNPRPGYTFCNHYYGRADGDTCY